MDQPRRFSPRDLIYLFPLFFGMVMLAAISLPLLLFGLFFTQSMPPRVLHLMVLAMAYLPSLLVWYKLWVSHEALADRRRWALIALLPLLGPILFFHAHRKPRLKLIKNLKTHN